MRKKELIEQVKRKGTTKPNKAPKKKAVQEPGGEETTFGEVMQRLVRVKPERKAK